ncbi:copia protein [Tanacetum coccineum]|uniref:Copia protein n=1 Tax=Tanacetum coccineum TaxID=301880 RepID=A0ABQ5GT06_9ASTR
MHSKFEMSMMGELKFLLGIEIHQSPRGIFINQDKYAQEILIKHGMTSCDSIGTPMAMKHLDADLSGTSVNQQNIIGACVFTDKWSFDELAYGVPTDGPYQTNHPSSDDINLYIRIDREVMSKSPKLLNESYVLYDRVMNPLTAQQKRRTRKDHGTRRGSHSTSSSSAFDQPSSSHLNDDDNDGNDEGTSRASTPSPTRFVNSLTNDVPQVFQNPPNIDLDMEPFYTQQTEIINR